MDAEFMRKLRLMREHTDERALSRQPDEPCPEAAVAALTTASSSADKLDAMRIFLQRWHGKKVAAPTGADVLASFYDLIEGVERVTVQNSLVPRDAINEENDRKAFYVENQHVCTWAVDVSSNDPDPIVWWRLNQDGEEWVREEERLSGFLVELVLFEATMGATYGASAAWVKPAKKVEITERMSRLPLGSWRWPGYPTEFYAREGALLVASPNGDAFSLWVGAKSPKALTFMEDLVDDSWEYIAF